MAGLFKNKIIKERLETFEIPEMEAKLEILRAWHKAYKNGSLREKTETQCEQAFNSDFFIKVLGYTSFPNETYTIQPKDRVEVKGGQIPDATLGYFDNGTKRVIAVVEIKDANTSLDKSQHREGNLSPIQQAFKYKPQFKDCGFVIATNFVEIRLFRDNQLDYELFTLDQLIDSKDDYFEFRKFFYLLSVQNFVRESGQTETEKLLSAIRIEQEEITNAFYKEYRKLREDLIRDIVANNSHIKRKDFYTHVVEKAQKIIDRLVFISFFEDSGLLPEGKLVEVVEYAQKGELGEPVWETLKKFFKAIDEGSERLGVPNGYNGELFKGDAELDGLKISDDVCKRFIKLGGYDFKEDLSVSILGHIFEQSITDLERLKSFADEGDVVTEKKDSKRKKDGIFYTPEYIVDYIVKSSLVKYLEEKEQTIIKKHKVDSARIKSDSTFNERLVKAYTEYQDFVRNIKVLDPACGSGAFLVKVFDYLLAENKRIARVLAEAQGSTSLSLLDTEDYVRPLLQNNIYGVDLNPESVEITKLSLWLKTAKRGQKLITLKDNIKCGNSLVDDEVTSEKSFKWELEFEKIIAEGGFDVVVGNPPYVNIYNMDKVERNYFDTSPFYETTHLKYDLYVLFVERGLRLLKSGGILSYIIPSVIFSVPYGRLLRKMIVEKHSILDIVDFTGFRVFKDAVVESCILVIKNITPSADNEVKIHRPLESVYDFAESSTVLNQSIFQNTDGYQFRLEMDGVSTGITKKIKEKSVTIGDIFYVSKGIVAFSKVDSRKKDDFLFDKRIDSKCQPYLEGKDVGRYSIEFKDKYLQYDQEIMSRPTFPELHQLPKILVRAISDGLNATADSSAFYVDQKLIVCSNRTQIEKYITPSKRPKNKIYAEASKVTDYAITGVLNSKLAKYYYTKVLKGGVSILPEDIRNFPIPRYCAELETINKLVGETIGLHSEFNTQVTNFLERVIGNMPRVKPSQQLSEFYKDDFSFFLKTIAKSGVILDLSQQDEWNKYFAKHSKMVSDIENHILRIDNEIDREVFRIYGLTEEEVQIISSI